MKFLLLLLLPSAEFLTRVTAFRKAVESHCAVGRPSRAANNEGKGATHSTSSTRWFPSRFHLDKMVHLNAQASTSAVSLDQLSSSELKDIKANILTEHFGWAPESFAKQGMDLANVAMYAATEAVEKILMEKVGMPHVEGEVALDEDEIQKVHLRRVLFTTGKELTRRALSRRVSTAWRPSSSLLLTSTLICSRSTCSATRLLSKPS